jgi:hypothetical protein
MERPCKPSSESVVQIFLNSGCGWWRGCTGKIYVVVEKDWDDRNGLDGFAPLQHSYFGGAANGGEILPNAHPSVELIHKVHNKGK